MNSYRKAAVVVGALFILATVSGIASIPFTLSILGDPDYLTKLNENETSVIIGALFELILAVSVTGIAIVI